MTATRLLGAAVLMALSAVPLCAQPDFGQATRLGDGWLFLDTDDTTAIANDYDDSRWQHIHVPHDWSITRPMSPDRGSCQGYLPGGMGWYRRRLSVDGHDIADGRRMFIYFEGVYNRSTVYVNGKHLGYRPSGFASFCYDLTPHLRAGTDNVIAVRVDHSRQNDARWYTGSGIYRDVWLVKAPATHFSLWGTAWRLKSITRQKAVVEVETDVTDATGRGGYSVEVEIRDATGTVVATGRARQKRSYTADGTTHTTHLAQITIAHPHRWTLSDPYLYKVGARLLSGSAETDHSSVTMGLRTLRFDANHGFALNDEWTKVKGVCLHDDAGVLGTAVPADVWRRRLQQLKTLGVNAIRMSHNPHAPFLYALCDTLGLLVMDEASDEWEFPKRKWLKGWNQGTPGFEGTYDYFEEWIERDVADMVRRDRCHPSIFLWSIGNEVDYPNDPYSHPILDGGQGGFTQPMYGGYKPDQPDARRIGQIAQRLAAVVRKADTSRPVTGALAGVVMSNQTAYPEAVDVVGYNYTESRYADDHKTYPTRVIYGSENRHDLPAWLAVRDNEHIFGQFLWTGIDYLGESGPWPARGSEAGLLNLAGDVKPIGHYRAALWSDKPVCYVGTYLTPRSQRRNNMVSPYAPPLWNYDEGQRVRVVCYTNAATARLTLNGTPIGGEPKRDANTDILYWDIDYTPGTLTAEAGGATASIETTGRPFALRATIIGEGEVKQVRVEVVDEDGRRVTLADNDITCFVRGSGSLLGMENGDIRDTSIATARHRRAHQGTLIAYIRCPQPDAVITFTSPLLKPATINLAHTSEP